MHHIQNMLGYLRVAGYLKVYILANDMLRSYMGTAPSELHYTTRPTGLSKIALHGAASTDGDISEDAPNQGLTFLRAGS